MHLVTRHPKKAKSCTASAKYLGARQNTCHTAVESFGVDERRNCVRLKKFGTCQSRLGLQVQVFSICFSVHPILWMISPLQQKPISHISSGWNRHLAILTLGGSMFCRHFEPYSDASNLYVFCWGRPRIRCAIQHELRHICRGGSIPNRHVEWEARGCQTFPVDYSINPTHLTLQKNPRQEIQHGGFTLLHPLKHCCRIYYLSDWMLRHVIQHKKFTIARQGSKNDPSLWGRFSVVSFQYISLYRLYLFVW